MRLTSFLTPEYEHYERAITIGHYERAITIGILGYLPKEPTSLPKIASRPKERKRGLSLDSKLAHSEP